MKLLELLPHTVARIPATIHVKLLTSLMVIVGLLVGMGLVSLQLIREGNRRVEELVLLQTKLAAYRRLQNDATEQLYNVSSALIAPDDLTLNAALRHMRQFGYDYERLQFVAQDEADLLAQVQGDYTDFSQLVTQVTDLIHAGKVEEARRLESAQAGPLADRLERRTNQLVNKAEAEVLTRIDSSRQAYLTSQMVIIVAAMGSIALALLLGYAVSWSLIGPIKRMDVRLKAIAVGDFAEHIEITNRDELGTLAANLNRMNDEIAAQSEQLTEWNRTLEQRVKQQVEEIQHARERIVGAREEERRRLRRDLHDGLGPTLASLFQRLDTVQTLVPRDPQSASALLVDLKSQMRMVIADIRRLVYELRPPTLDEFGLLGAIREYVARLQGTNSLQLRVQGPDVLPPLPAAVEVAAYRIALESLTNIIRHAQASECCVHLSLSDALYLEVEDNGVGIPPANRAGVGLRSMRERAAELGGTLVVESAPAGGTRILAQLPLSF